MNAFIHDALLTAISFMIVLGLVIAIHELGHFTMARGLGIAVDRFSLGFGRALLRWTDRAGVEWRIGWIPLGGYVRFAGDAEASSSVPDADSLQQLRREIVAREGVGAELKYYHFKPVWARSLVAAAGPFANFLLSIVLFAVLLSVVGEIMVKPRVGEVMHGSAAERAGFLKGDYITSIDGRPVGDFGQVSQYVLIRAGEPIRFQVQRGGAIESLTATPDRKPEQNGIGGTSRVGVLGLRSSILPGDVFRRHYSPVQAVVRGTEQTWEIISTTVFYIYRMVTGRESGDQLGGPLSTGAIAGAMAKAGMESAPDLGGKLAGITLNLLRLTAIISAGIGFMNLLPVPVLDGGHLLFYAYEAAARRPLGARVQAVGYRVGLALLLGLMLFATWNDLHQLRLFKIFGGLFS